MPRAKLKVGRNKALQYKKNKRVSCKIPKGILKRIAEIKERHSVKSDQAVFDYLVISGVVYFDRNIIELVDERIDFYKDRHEKMQLSRLGKCEAPEFPETKTKQFLLFPKDFKAFNDFCIEKNYAKQWVVELLFDAFAKEEPRTIDIILKNQKLNVRSRKKQLARIAEDKWVKILPTEDQQLLLNQLTEMYEERKFEESLQGEIDKLLERKKKKESEEDSLERELNAKVEQLRFLRTKEMNELSRPRDPLTPSDEDLG